MSKYNITQPEYLKLPTINFSGNRLQLCIVNFLLKAQRLFFKLNPTLQLKTYHVPTDDGATLKLIHLKSKNLSDDQPSVLYFHGGAFFLTYGLGHLTKVQWYAMHANVNVFLATYRLSGSHPFPTPFTDSYENFRWLIKHKEKLHIADKLIVAGDSAGGALAAAVAQKATDEGSNNIAGQMLIYPVIDGDADSESALKFADTPVWNTKNNQIMWKTYLAGSNPGTMPRYASPIHHDNFVGLPSAYIEVAEFDPLHDEGQRYAKVLSDAGVTVELNVIKGGVHAYDFAPDCEPIKQSLDKRCNYIQKILEAD